MCISDYPTPLLKMKCCDFIPACSFPTERLPQSIAGGGEIVGGGAASRVFEKLIPTACVLPTAACLEGTGPPTTQHTEITPSEDGWRLWEEIQGQEPGKGDQGRGWRDCLAPICQGEVGTSSVW